MGQSTRARGNRRACGHSMLKGLMKARNTYFRSTGTGDCAIFQSSARPVGPTHLAEYSSHEAELQSIQHSMPCPAQATTEPQTGSVLHTGERKQTIVYVSFIFAALSWLNNVVLSGCRRAGRPGTPPLKFALRV